MNWPPDATLKVFSIFCSKSCDATAVAAKSEAANSPDAVNIEFLQVLMVLIVLTYNPPAVTLFQKCVPRRVTNDPEICNYQRSVKLYSDSSYETTGDNLNRRQTQCQRGFESKWRCAVDHQIAQRSGRRFCDGCMRWRTGFCPQQWTTLLPGSREGRMLWVNELSGYGYGLASICVPGMASSPDLAAVRAIQAQREAANSGTAAT